MYLQEGLGVLLQEVLGVLKLFCSKIYTGFLEGSESYREVKVLLCVKERFWGILTVKVKVALVVLCIVSWKLFSRGGE